MGRSGAVGASTGMSFTQRLGILAFCLAACGGDATRGSERAAGRDGSAGAVASGPAGSTAGATAGATTPHGDGGAAGARAGGSGGSAGGGAGGATGGAAGTAGSVAGAAGHGTPIGAGGATSYDGVLPFTPDAAPAGTMNALKARTAWRATNKDAALNGPVWLASAHALLFTDSSQGKILQLDGSGNVTTWGEFSGRPVGLALASDATLVACEVGSKRVVTIDVATKKETVVVDSVDGHAFTGPWECDVGRDGTIYFIDPNGGAERPIYSVRQGRARLLTKLNWEVAVHLSLAQDLLLSPADWPGHVVTALPLQTDGSVGDRVRWGEMRREGGAGMCLDRAGNVYVTGIQGVEVFKRTDGSRYDEFVWVNADGNDYDTPTNCTFGDDDGRTLYVTVPNAILKARVDVPGLPN